MKMLLSVALGGALGASARYLFAAQALRLFGPNFPWGTLGVNVIGSFLIGALVEAGALRLSLTPEMRAFLVTGVLGGFTTFSAYSLDVANLFEKKQAGLALLYAFGSMGLSIAAVFAGLYAVRAVLT